MGAFIIIEGTTISNIVYLILEVNGYIKLIVIYIILQLEYPIILGKP